MTATRVHVDGRVLSLSNLEKVLYPATGLTKGQIIDYYTRVAPALLPHLRRRPLTLKRYPNGVDAAYFFEKQCPSHRPPWVNVAPIQNQGRRSGGRIVEYCLADDLPTVVWVANLASLELHTSLSLAGAADTPTTLVFDLDPGAPAAVLECARVAMWLREDLKEMGLRSVVKTSGSKGLQVYVPLNTPITYAETKPFARALAVRLENEHPELVVSSMSKDLRTGKVFIDWSQNDPHKTTVSVYSLRALAQPTVSTPLKWDEVEGALSAGEPDRLVFTFDDVLGRVDADGDLFADVAEGRQDLPPLPDE